MKRYEHLKTYSTITKFDEFQKQSQLAILEQLVELNAGIKAIIELNTPKVPTEPNTLSMAEPKPKSDGTVKKNEEIKSVKKVVNKK